MALRSVLLTGLTGASALVPPLHRLVDQLPLGRLPEPISTTQFQCNLPPAIDPAGDGLPSANELFSSEEALAKQIERHQAIVRVPTVSYDDNGEPGEDERWTPFWDLHEVLESLYPKIHERATLEKVNTLGLVYTIEGSDPTLKPTLLAAHQDVVPVPDASTWTHPPFAAVYDGEWLWGRGASDDKNSLTALLSAVETLLSNEEWKPTRTLVLAFGFDEECSGYRGARAIGDFLTERYGDDGIAVILDEGGLGMQLIENNTLYALPAVIEKGHVDIWIELSVVGGHSSMPFPHTGIGIIAEIISKLEDNPYEPQLLDDSPVHHHLQCLARHSPDFQPEITRLVNAGDLEGLTREVVDIQRGSRYMIQTSQSVDIIEGGQKINAMPEHVTLGVNYRVAPQNSIAEVQHNLVKHIQSVVDKYDLQLEAFEGDDGYQSYLSEHPLESVVNSAEKIDYNGTLTLKGSEQFDVTPVSPIDNEAWDVFAGTIRHVFQFEGGEVVPVGEIMTGNTDTRHYLNLSPNIYRWSPTTQTASVNIHTIDERVRMDAHMDMVKFYYDFVRNFDKAKF